MLSLELRNEVEKELARAEKARQEGLEGRSRVCARRAAGMVLRAYYETHPMTPAPPSAYDTLQLLRDDPQMNPELRQIAELLLTRVNQDFHLPEEIDLVAATRRLVEIIEKDIN